MEHVTESKVTNKAKRVRRKKDDVNLGTTFNFTARKGTKELDDKFMKCLEEFNLKVSQFPVPLKYNVSELVKTIVVESLSNEAFALNMIDSLIDNSVTSELWLKGYNMESEAKGSDPIGMVDFMVKVMPGLCKSDYKRYLRLAMGQEHLQ